MATAKRILIVLLLFLPLNLAYAGGVSLFNTENDAQKHCPNDVVVWVNLPSGIYHFRDMRWYGATAHGAFVCQKEADQNGYRATRNGQ
jgi:hypothetical protein